MSGERSGMYPGQMREDAIARERSNEIMPQDFTPEEMRLKREAIDRVIDMNPEVMELPESNQFKKKVMDLANHEGYLAVYDSRHPVKVPGPGEDIFA